jgi:hypothetical protein
VPLDVATQLRLPGRYRLGSAILHLLFGVTPRQRLEPVVEALEPAIKKIEPVLNNLPEGKKVGPTAGKAAAAGLLATAAVLLFSLLRGRR